MAQLIYCGAFDLLCCSLSIMIQVIRLT